MTNPILPADLDRMERVLERYAASASIAYLGRNEVTAGDARALIAAVRAAQRPEADKPKCPTCGGSRFVVVGSPVAGNISAHNEPCPTCVSPTDKLRKAHGTLVDVEGLPPHLQEILRDPKAPAPLPADAGMAKPHRTFPCRTCDAEGAPLIALPCGHWPDQRERADTKQPAPSDAGKLDEEIEKALTELCSVCRSPEMVAHDVWGPAIRISEARQAVRALIRARCAPAGDAAGLREAVVTFLDIFDSDDSKGFRAAIERMRRLSAPPSGSTEAPVAGDGVLRACVVWGSGPAEEYEPHELAVVELARRSLAGRGGER